MTLVTDATGAEKRRVREQRHGKHTVEAIKHQHLPGSSRIIEGNDTVVNSGF